MLYHAVVIPQCRTIACAIVGFRLDFSDSVLNQNFFLQDSLYSVLSKYLGASCNFLNTNYTYALESLLFSDWQFIDYKLVNQVHHSLYNACPQYDYIMLLNVYIPTCQLCSAALNLLSQPSVNTAFASRGPWLVGPFILNFLPPHPRSVNS